MRFGVMFEDGSVRAQWTGPNQYLQARVDVMEHPWTLVVRWDESDQSWDEVWPVEPLPFEVLTAAGPYDGPRVGLRCLLCPSDAWYATGWHSQAWRALPPMLEHLQAKHDDRCPELEPDEGDGTHFWRTQPDGTRSCEWCLQVEPRAST